MDKKQAIIIAKEYAKSVKMTMNPTDIFLFGSYAKGYANKHSDIDIAVVYDVIGDDY